MRRYRLLASCVVAVFLAFAFVGGGPASPALAATSVDDISHLDFEVGDGVKKYQVTAPSSVISASIKRSMKANEGRPAFTPVERAAVTNKAANMLRVTNTARQLNNAAAGVSVKDWLSNQGTVKATVPPAAQGVTSAGNKALAVSQKSRWTVPSTALGSVTKVANGVTSVMLGADVGFMVGKGISAMAGMSPDGALCNPTFEDFGIIAAITAADCFEFAPEYTLNQDANGNTVFPNACISGGGCAIIKAEVMTRFDNGNEAGKVVCMVMDTASGYPANNSQSPGSLGANGQWFLVKGPTGNWELATVQGWNATNPWSPTYRACDAAVGGRGPGFWTGNYEGRSGINLNGSPLEELARGYGWCKGTYDTCTGRWGAIPVQGATTPVEGDADPERTLECVISGTNGVNYTAVTAPYRESGGALPNPVCPALPDGVIADGIKINENAQGQPSEELVNEPTTEEYQDWATKYPECGTGMCILDLRKGTGTSTQSCFDAPLACQQWFTDPAKETTYSCTYGGYSMVLAECNIYANVLDPEKTTTGAPYSDPDTGTSAPAGSAPYNPKDDVAGMGRPAMDADKPRNCWPSGWGILNPLNWVMMPVQCALEWAFVPPKSKLDSYKAKFALKFDNSAVGKILGQLSGIMTPLADIGDSCEGPPFVFNAFGINETYYPMSACDAPMDAIAATLKGVGGGVVYLVSFLAVLRYVAGAFGYMSFGGGSSTAVERVRFKESGE